MKKYCDLKVFFIRRKRTLGNRKKASFYEEPTVKMTLFQGDIVTFSSSNGNEGNFGSDLGSGDIGSGDMLD